MALLIIVLLFCLLQCTMAQFSFYEGDRCKTGHFEGECKLLDNCPQVNADLSLGKPVDLICGFIGYEVVVCCPPDPEILTTTTTTTSTTESPVKVASEARFSKTNILYIAGGTKSPPRRYPHMAAVGFDSDEGIQWLCGGTLVSQRFVLTAAHCVFSMAWGNATWVRLGDLNLMKDDDDARPQDIRVVQRIKHPDYKPPLLYHDIALLKLEKSIQYDPWIRPACLPTEDTLEDEYGIATGWGKVEWLDESGSEDLLEVVLTIVKNEECNEFYKNDEYKLNHGVVSNWQICAGGKGKDTCQGDSGGPLVVINSRRYCIYDVIGVTSVGRLCGSTVPGIYTRVSHYVPWLKKIIGM